MTVRLSASLAISLLIVDFIGCTGARTGRNAATPGRIHHSLSMTEQWRTGARGSRQGEFLEPRAISVDPFGNIYVADTGNNRVQVFDEEGDFIDQVGRYGSGDGFFFRPCNVNATDGFRLFVADTENGRIQSFAIEHSGRYFTFSRILVDRQDLQKTHPSLQDFRPVSLAITPDGNYIAGDISRGALLFFDHFMRLERIVGVFEREDTKVLHPGDIVTGKDDLVLVSDRDRHGIVVLSPFGSFMRLIGRKGAAPGEFIDPGGICVDAWGNIFVADTGNRRIQVLDSDGGFISELAGDSTTGKSTFSPVDLFLFDRETLYVLDIGGCALIKYHLRYSR
jgi:hypothetical protein